MFRRFFTDLGARRSPDEFRAAWRSAALGAVVAFGAGLLVCVVLATALDALEPASESPGTGVSPVSAGGLLYYASQRVPIVSEFVAPRGFNSGPVAGFRSSFAFPPLGGLMIVLAAFAAGGFVAARAAGGSERTRIVAGFRIVLPLAALSFVFSYVLGIDFPEEQGGGMRLNASPFGALVAPLAWGAIAATAGAGIAVWGRRGVRERLSAALERRFTGWLVPVTSALRALRVAALLVLFAGVCATAVQAVQKPHVASDVLSDGRAIGAILIGTLLLLPSGMAAGTLGTMGIPAVAGFGGFDGVVVSIFGGRVATPDELGPSQSIDVPAYALAGLLIAAIATLWMGYTAARATAGGARDRRRAALRAALPFSVGCWILGFLTTATLGGFFGASFSFQSGFESEEVTPPPIRTLPPVPFDPPQFDPPTFDPPMFDPSFPPFGEWQPTVVPIPSPAAYVPVAHRTRPPQAQTFTAGGSTTAGPSLPGLALLPPLWGLAGGAAGAWLFERRRGAHPPAVP